VTREVWDQVQAILDGRVAKKAGKRMRVFSYSGMLRCGQCECSLVGELKKGRYVYYHCTGYRGKCGEAYTREEVIEQQLTDGLRELVLPPTVVNWLNGSAGIGSDGTSSARADTGARPRRGGTITGPLRGALRRPAGSADRRGHVRQERPKDQATAGRHTSTDADR
jgi:hypothetical protein